MKLIFKLIICTLFLVVVASQTKPADKQSNFKRNTTPLITKLSAFNCPGCCALGIDPTRGRVCACPSECTCQSISYCECPKDCGCKIDAEGNKICIG